MKDVKGQSTRRGTWRRVLLVVLCAVALTVAAFLIYTGRYYRADAVARAMLGSGDGVAVTRTDYGWRFDGPSEADALIFYPGAKVEAASYAPLLHGIAKGGMDVCLVEMPFRLAIFGRNRADRAMAAHDYSRWFIGGHSLGGAMAADYAARRASKLTGVVLLAAYSLSPLDDRLLAITIYGSKDGVLNMDRMAEGDRFLPEGHRKYVIEGGNHAQFGNYGEQRGDGRAAVSAAEQQRRTAELILESLSSDPNG